MNIRVFGVKLSGSSFVLSGRIFLARVGVVVMVVLSLVAVVMIKIVLLGGVE